MRPACVLLACLLLSRVLPAQEELLSIDPPLRQSFPLEAVTGGIHVKFPVLLNVHTVLQPGSILRFIYLDSYATDRARRDEAQSGSGDGSPPTQGTGQKRSNSGPYGGWSGDASNEYTGFWDQLRKEDARGSKTELRSEVWTQEEPFRDALDHAAEAGTTFVYSPPLQAKTESAVMDLPEGMLLGEVNGQVMVLAMESKSRVYHAGVRAGDQIVSLGDDVPMTSLKDFAREWEATQHKAKVTGSSSYPLQIVRGDTHQPVAIHVEAPPTIPSLF